MSDSQNALVVVNNASSSNANKKSSCGDIDNEEEIPEEVYAIYQTRTSDEVIANLQDEFYQKMAKTILSDKANLETMLEVNKKLREKNAILTSDIKQNNDNKFRLFYKQYMMFKELDKLIEENSYLFTEKDLEI